MTFGSASAIYFAASDDQGRSFSPPVKVAEVASLALGRHRGPRIAATKTAIVISAIVSERAGVKAHENSPESGNLIAWRSTDGGRTWVRVAAINDHPSAAREGLHTMAAGANGKVFAAWLDLRAKGTRLVGAVSTDGGASWSKNTTVYESPSGSICECCHPSAAFSPAGEVWVMWRNAIDGYRDMWLSSSPDGAKFSSATKVGAGTWKLAACPMDGGDVEATGAPVTVWRRDGQIFLHSPGHAEEPLGAGKDAAVARGRDGIYAAWTQGTSVVMKSPSAAEPVSLSTEGGFARLLRLASGDVLAAWETPTGIETKRLP